MKATIIIPLKKNDSLKALKSLQAAPWETKRVKTILKSTSKGLKIMIESGDVNGLRAATNTVLKLYKLHSEVKKWSMKTTKN